MSVLFVRFPVVDYASGAAVSTLSDIGSYGTSFETSPDNAFSLKQFLRAVRYGIRFRTIVETSSDHRFRVKRGVFSRKKLRDADSFLFCRMCTRLCVFSQLVSRNRANRLFPFTSCLYNVPYKFYKGKLVDCPPLL